MKDTDLVDIVKIVDSLKDIKKGDQGEPLRFEDLTPEQIKSLTGKQGEDGPRGPVGPRWEFSDLTKEQRNELTLKFSHLTEQDKDELRLRFEHLTETQLDELKLKFKHLTKEDKEELRLKFEHLSEANKKELKGDKGESFKFKDLTKEQKRELKGEQGDKGDKGDDGLSVYELAKKNGFKGTEAQWLASLKGKDGQDGKSIQVTEQSLKKHKHSTGDITGLEEYVQDVIGNSLVEGTNITIDYDTNTGLTTINSTGGGGGASSYEVTQNGHGFIQTEWLYFDETDDTYKKAQSNSVDTLGAWHVVEVVDANTFKIAKDGVHEITNTLDLGEYVLSQDTAGGYTQTLPGDLGDYVLYGMEVLSDTHISFYIVPAIPVGDTGDGVQSVVAGTGITVDNTDPLNPIINATGGSGTVTSVAISGSDGLEVDSGSPITTTGTIALGVNKTSMLSHLNVEDGADVTDATNVASAGAFMKATDDTDDITEGATNLFMDSTEQGKLANITVTQAVDLDQMEIDIAALANGMVYKGNRDASAGTFPGGGIAQTGRFYTVSVGGTVDSVVFAVDDRLVATVDNASTTTYAGNWTKLDATDAVTSVNGQVGNVVLDPDDLDDSLTTNKFVTAADITKLGNLSGTNTGDQTSIVGITGTIAQFNTALTDGDFATLAGSETLSNKTLTAPKFADLGFIADANGNEMLILDTATTAVNELTLSNAPTGQGPVIKASGGDTNIGIFMYPKGTGELGISSTSTSKSGGLRLYEASTNGFNYVAFIAPSILANSLVFTLPDAYAGANGYALTATTAGVMSWTDVSLNSITATHTALQIELGHATDTTISRVSAGVLAVEGVVVPTVSSTNTLTNKRITDRVGTVASSATPTINTDNVDAYSITALATAITSMTTNLSGTPTDFQKLLIRIKDNGTARAITWGASFEAKGVALPTTTVISKVLTVGFVYDTVSAKWGCIASAQEA